MRGRSSFQVGRSITARMSLAALPSAFSMNHHQKSSASVENFKVVPAKVRRLRSTFSASLMRASRCGAPGKACSTRSQSMTAAVGQRWGSMLKLSSMRASARPWRASAAKAASLRTVKPMPGVMFDGTQASRCSLPCTNRLRPLSMASLACSGNSKPASCVADRT